MKNPDVELKLMRTLVTDQFGHKKVVELDNYYYDQTELIDEDCKSIVDIINKIKRNELSIDLKSAQFIYSALFPSVKKDILSENLVRNLVEELTDQFTLFDFFKVALKKDVFSNINFYVLCIFYNVSYYKINKSFFVISSAIESDLKKALNEDIYLFEKILANAVEMNSDYQIVKKQFDISDIRNIISSIKDQDLRFYGIKSIYLFGSYAKKRNTIYSDLDLHVVVTKFKDFLNEQADILSAFFTHLFQTKVDVKVTALGEKISFNLSCLLVKEILLK